MLRLIFRIYFYFRCSVIVFSYAQGIEKNDGDDSDELGFGLYYQEDTGPSNPNFLYDGVEETAGPPSPSFLSPDLFTLAETAVPQSSSLGSANSLEPKPDPSWFTKQDTSIKNTPNPKSTLSTDSTKGVTLSLDRSDRYAPRAGEKLAQTLLSDPELLSLYIEAFAKFEIEKFEQVHDNLLRTLFNDFTLTLPDASFLNAVRLLQQESVRTQTNLFLQQLCQAHKPLAEPTLDQLSSGDGDQSMIGSDEGTEGKDHGSKPSASPREPVLKALFESKAFELFKSDLSARVNPATTVEAALKTKSPLVLTRLLATNTDETTLGNYAWVTELIEAGYSIHEIAEILLQDANESPWIRYERHRDYSLAKWPVDLGHAIGCVHHYSNFPNDGKAPKQVADRLKDAPNREIIETEEIEELCGLAGITSNSAYPEPFKELVTFDEKNSIAAISYSTENTDVDTILARNINILERLCIATRRMQQSGLCCDSFTSTGVAPARERLSWDKSIFQKHSLLSATSAYETKKNLVVLENIKFTTLTWFYKRLVKLRLHLNSAERVDGGNAYATVDLKYKAIRRSAGGVERRLTHRTRIDYGKIFQRLRKILRHVDIMIDPDPVLDDTSSLVNPLEASRLKSLVHYISLGTQFLALALLSYNQGHVGLIKPFFLDTPQHTILLTGTNNPSLVLTLQQQASIQDDNNPEFPCLIMEPVNLTCMGDAIGDTILAVRYYNRQPAAVLEPSRGVGYIKFDLCASPDDILDTWGPGNFISQGDKLSRWICAIKIFGGYIYRSNDGNPPLFHWSASIGLADIPPTSFHPGTRIRIGAPVEVNSTCTIDMAEGWERSKCAFENIGVHGDYWKYDEAQLGAQAGNYVLLQANITRRKIPGTTLKQQILAQEKHGLIGYLNCLCGLQVSFCTGVSRRVPLRELIADLFPTIISLSFRRSPLRDELNDQYNPVNAFRNNTVQDYLDNIPPHVYGAVLSVIHKTLHGIRSTGIDPEGKFFSVAWFNAHGEPPVQCLRIVCNERKNSWVQVLADSEDCATFAYISPNCLVTSEIQCRGSSPLWCNATPLLETAVLQHNNTPSRPLGPLETNKTYFFKKMDSFLKVTVDRRATSSDVSLLFSPSKIPSKFVHRLYVTERNQWIRIREAAKSTAVDGVEEVVVLTNLENSLFRNRLSAIPTPPPPPL
ncbi:hypothetical protein TWF694_011145 [Orbilia ellipsospora]|uniref:Uncharacterized protein n=1 Tax=Orbilia ellipsospora TaxID=2528407 RepID=A0AAV9X9H7_9PEZI